MNFIEKIDNYFYSKEQKEILMTYLLVVVLIGFIFFYFLLPTAQKYSQKQHKEFLNNNSKLAIFKTTNKSLNIEIIKLKKSIKNLTLQKVALKKQKDFYEELANLLDFVEFNQQKWGNFVKNLVANATAQGLDVLGFENKVYDMKSNGSINKKMDITIKLNGDYKDLIQFIYSYENTKDLLRVEDININSDKNYQIKFVLYGYNK